MTRRPAYTFAVLSGVLLLLTLVGSAETAASTTDRARLTAPDPPSVRFVAPSGSDRNAGTIERPWRTIGKAINTLRPGQTAYLRAGDYVEAVAGPCHERYNSLDWRRSGAVSAPITLAVYPADRGKAIVRTQLNLRGDHLRVSGLIFERNTAYSTVDRRCSGSQNITIRGNHVDLVGIEVRNSNMSGVYLREAEGLTIVRSWIHNNGAHLGQDHGVYVSASSALLIANSVIDANIGYGIHIYPDITRGARVLHNTIVRNRRSGLIISESSEHNVIANNIFAFNGEYGVREHELSGSDNRLVSNLMHGNALSPTWFPDERVEESMSYFGPPRFLDLDAGDLRLGPMSSALDRGTLALSRPLDFLGRRRPRGSGPDLGAFERQ